MPEIFEAYEAAAMRTFTIAIPPGFGKEWQYK
jgi:hypothetical protein